MVNHHKTTIWENIAYSFRAPNKQIWVITHLRVLGWSSKWAMKITFGIILPSILGIIVNNYRLITISQPLMESRIFFGGSGDNQRFEPVVPLEAWHGRQRFDAHGVARQQTRQRCGAWFLGPKSEIEQWLVGAPGYVCCFLEGDEIAACSSIGIISSSHSKDLVLHQAMIMECHVIVFCFTKNCRLPKMEESENLYVCCIFFGNSPIPPRKQPKKKGTISTWQVKRWNFWWVLRKPTTTKIMELDPWGLRNLPHFLWSWFPDCQIWEIKGEETYSVSC